MGGRRGRGDPDVSVLHEPPGQDQITEVPLVAVEVLSPGTRSEDTVRKSTEYLAAGIHQYWLVDPVESIVEVFQKTPQGWAVVARLDQDSPRASVEVGSHGRVDLDLAEVLT
jgi:Uma2 family endonuclease